jgi:hypothetical protein
MPDEDEGGEDWGEKLVEQVDRSVGKQQAQLIHNLGSKMAHKTGFKTSSLVEIWYLKKPLE